MADVAAAIDTSRLVTLTGAGGAGKTSLAVEVARSVESEYADGVWLVELAPLTNPSQVPDAVVAALGLGLAETVPGRSPLLDGFGLIAFASLFPMMTVMAYAQISEYRALRAARLRRSRERSS